MSIILAIEPDRRRAAQLTGMARTHLTVELLVAANASQAVDALAGRVPDVLLTAPLLPSHEEAAIADHLRQLGSVAAHVQTLTIPLLANGSGDRDRPVLSAFRRTRAPRSEAEGCDPAVFAEQITDYLREARERRVVPTTVEVPAPAPVETSAGETLPAARTLVKKETISELLARLFPSASQEDEPAAPELAFPPEPSGPAFRRTQPDRASTTYELPPVPPVDPVASGNEEPLSFALPATSVRQIGVMPPREGAEPVDVAVAVSMNAAVSMSGTVSMSGAVSMNEARRGGPSGPQYVVARPVQDEWGFFDPNQCGFPALVAKLDEISARDNER